MDIKDRGGEAGGGKGDGKIEKRVEMEGGGYRDREEGAGVRGDKDRREGEMGRKEEETDRQTEKREGCIIYG